MEKIQKRGMGIGQSPKNGSTSFGLKSVEREYSSLMRDNTGQKIIVNHLNQSMIYVRYVNLVQRLTWMEDDHLWETAFDGRQPLMEDDL